VTQEDPPRLRRLNRSVPADLETVIHKAIAREPSQRYASAAALREDLERFLEGRPILARRVSPGERAWRWCKRNPAVAGLLGTVAALLMAGLVGSTAAAFHFRRIADSETAARQSADRARAAADGARAQALAAQREADARRHEAEASRAEAERQSKAAEANFARAREAVDDSFTKVSESRLLSAPGMQTLRLDLLRSALTFYEAFLKERADDRSLRRELLATRLRVGRIQRELGRWDEARSTLRSVVDGYTVVLRDRPHDLDLTAGLAEATFELARSERSVEARASGLERAVALGEDLLKSRPGDLNARKELGDAYNSLGVVQSNRGLRDEAITAYQRSALLRLDVAEARPDDPDVPMTLAQTLNNIAVELARRGASGQVQAMHQQAVAFAEAAVQLKPNDLDSGSGLGVLYNNLANSLWAANRREDAIGYLRRRAEHLLAQARTNPAVGAAQTAAIDAAAQLAARFKEQGRKDEALRALRLARDPIGRHPAETADQLVTCARIRHFYAERLAALRDDLPPDVRRERDEVLDEALGFLDRAVAAGFSNAESLWGAGQFALLRDRDGFKALVAKAEAAARAKATARAGDAPAGPKVGAPGAPDTGAPAPRVQARARRASLLQAIGQVKVDLGHPEDALSLLNEALSLREALLRGAPRDEALQVDLARTRIALGNLHKKADRPDRARECWEQALPTLIRAAREPGGSPIWMDVGRVRAELGRSEEAAAAFDTLLSLEPAHPRDRNYSSARTGALEDLARRDEAYAALLKRRPQDGHLWTARGRYHARRGRWAQAADDFARGIASAPPDSEEWFEHAGLRLIVGDEDGYRRFASQAWRRAGQTRDPWVAYNVAFTCLLGADPGVEPGEVVRLAEIASADTRGSVRHTTGVALFRAGRYAEAVEALERGIRGSRESPLRVPVANLSNPVLAMAYFLRGDTDKARILLAEVEQYVRGDAWDKTERAVLFPSTGWIATNAYYREAEALIRGGPRADAVAAETLGRAQDACERLVRGDPTNALYQRDLAAVLTGLAELDRRAGRPDRARARLTRAESLLTQSVERGAGDLDPWLELGRARDGAGRTAEAAAAFAKALDLSSDVRNSDWFRTAPAAVADALACRDDVFAYLAGQRPSDERLWAARLVGLLHRGDWARAAAVYDTMAGLQPDWVASDEIEAHHARIGRAATLLLAGDREGYRRLCREAHERFAGTSRASTMMLIHRPCVLDPDPGVEPGLCSRMVGSALQGELPDPYNWPAACLFVSGAAHFRAGRYAQAIRDCKESAERYPNWSVVANWLVLAMASQRSGRTDDARAWWGKANGWFVERPTSDFRPPAGIHADHWLELLVLRREAEAVVLHDPAFPADPFAP
jgi:tetratricopeptide (TPR) repeat protein